VVFHRGSIAVRVYIRRKFDVSESILLETCFHLVSTHLGDILVRVSLAILSDNSTRRNESGNKFRVYFRRVISFLNNDMHRYFPFYSLYIFITKFCVTVCTVGIIMIIITVEWNFHYNKICLNNLIHEQNPIHRYNFNTIRSFVSSSHINIYLHKKVA